MKKVKGLLAIVLVITAFSAQSQVQHRVGVNNGLEISNVTTLSTEYRVGNHYGFMYEALFKEKYSLSLELNYNQRGYKDKISFYLFNQGMQPPAITSLFNEYLSLPIKIGYSTGQQLKKFINIGVIPSLLLSSERTIPFYNSGGISNDLTYDSRKDMSQFDIGALVEVGLSHDVSERINLFTSAMYKHSFNSFVKEFEEIQIRHHGFSLSIGLKYNL